MSVILNKHMPAVITQLGDGTLTTPYFPGQNTRSNGLGVNLGNTVGYEDYPTTTPNNITKLIRGPQTLSVYGATIIAAPCGCTDVAIVTSGFPPAAIPGSPFNNDTRSSTGYASTYPRWTGETPWDWQAFPATDAFTPQGIDSPGLLAYPYPGIGTAAKYGVSLDSGVLPNDVWTGGVCIFGKVAYWKFFAYTTDFCCWNRGYQIEVNLDVWKIPFTATPVMGTAGYQDFTLGSASYHSTETQTLIIDYTWETGGSYIQVGLDVQIPQVTGHFTFVNDFYISSVTAP